MKKFLVSLILSILFVITIIFSLISLTVLNDHYITFIFSKNDIYNDIAKEIVKDYEEHNISKDFDSDEVKNDLECYISKRYDKSKLSLKKNDIYYDHITFMKEIDMKKVSYFIYSITLLFIIITGTIFVHSKRYHHLDLIYLISSVLIFIISGYIYVMIDLNNNIFNIVLKTTNHVLLGVGVFIFELVFLKYGNILIHKHLKK